MIHVRVKNAYTNGGEENDSKYGRMIKETTFTVDGKEYKTGVYSDDRYRN